MQKQLDKCNACIGHKHKPKKIHKIMKTNVVEIVAANTVMDTINATVATAPVAPAPIQNAVPEDITPLKGEQLGISYAEMQKAFNAILKETRTLNQCVKVFGGILNHKIQVGEHYQTIKGWLRDAGVEFTPKGGVTAKAILAAWPFKDERGNMLIYKNVPGYIMGGTEEKPKQIPVFHFNGAKWEKITQYKLINVDKWSVETILRGLLQGAYPTKVADKIKASNDAWNEITDCYFFEKRCHKGGEENKAITVQKNSVCF